MANRGPDLPAPDLNWAWRDPVPRGLLSPRGYDELLRRLFEMPKLAGRWAWHNQYGNVPIEQCVQRVKDARLDGIIIKYGYPAIERAFTAASIPWATERYAYPSQPEREAHMLANAVDAGAVAAIINAEVEWEGEGYGGQALGGIAMIELISAFRARHPTVELYASVDTRGNRLSAPYQQVLRQHVAGWLPMVYPLAFRPHRPEGYVAAAFRDCLDNRDFGGVPVLPTIQTYDGIGPEAVQQQLAEVPRRGLTGYQAYTVGHATDEEWAVIVAAPSEEQPPAPLPAQVLVEELVFRLEGIELLGRGDYDGLTRKLAGRD